MPDDDLKPLLDVDGDPVFDEPWQAQALAMADSLVQSGLFTAVEWSAELGRVLQQAKEQDEADNHDTYYRCVMLALENLIAGHSDIDVQSVDQKQKDWENAYRKTPHGMPVILE